MTRNEKDRKCRYETFVVVSSVCLHVPETLSLHETIDLNVHYQAE